MAGERMPGVVEVEVSGAQLDDGVRCTICMVDFHFNEKAQMLPCSHVYHNECITEWLRLRTTCPVCRRVVVEEIFDSEESFELDSDYSLEDIHIHAPSVNSLVVQLGLVGQLEIERANGFIHAEEIGLTNDSPAPSFSTLQSSIRMSPYDDSTDYYDGDVSTGTTISRMSSDTSLATLNETGHEITRTFASTSFSSTTSETSVRSIQNFVRSSQLETITISEDEESTISTYGAEPGTITEDSFPTENAIFRFSSEPRKRALSSTSTSSEETSGAAVPRQIRRTNHEDFSQHRSIISISASTTLETTDHESDETS